MDNNMIKIDDLLRQRFDGAEEQERPAAWMQMRDLLDKQMPVGKVPAAINWRRMFGYVAGVVLLAAISVGGYEMSESFSTQKLADNNIGKGNGAPHATTGLAGSAINSLPDTRVEAEAAQNPAPATDAAGTLNTATSENTAGNTQTNFNSTTNNNTNHTNTKGNKQSSNNTGTALAAASTKTAANANTNNNNTPDVAANNTKAQKTQQNATKQNNSNNDAANNQQMVASSGSSVSNKPGAGVTQPVASATKEGGNSSSAKTADKAGENYVDKTVRKIERSGKEGVAKLDTVFDGNETFKVKQPSNAVASSGNDNEMSGGNIVPASAAPAAMSASADDAPMQKLGDHKTDSRKMKNYNPHRFEEMVQNAKYNLGNIKFHTGIVGGMNAAVNGNVGWHLGFAGSLAVSERWNILTEIKYAYKWNGAKENMQDDYITNVNSSVINGQSVYTYDSMEHYYNFTNFQSLELPVMVTYTKNRYVFMVGANFRYNFKISNLQEVEQIYLSQQEIKTSTEPVTSTDKRVLLSDFSSSMNIGPMIGFGYMVTPSVRVDGRINQSLWNNSGTYGQKAINKGLYNMPQVQFNVSYRFSSNKALKKPRR